MLICTAPFSSWSDLKLRLTPTMSDNKTSQNCIATSLNESKLHCNKSQRVKIALQQVNNKSKLNSDKSQRVKNEFQQDNESKTSYSVSKRVKNECNVLG